MTIYTISAVALFAANLSLSAEIKLPAFFSDGMVLQQETGAKIWGTSDAGASVEVEFAGQTLTAKAGNDSKWMVNFKDLKMSKTGATMSISSGNDKREIKDVLVGEVWIASGQSNMEWTLNATTSAEDAKTAEDNLLRVYVSGNVTAIEPLTDFIGAWKSTHPTNNARFTAVGYEFAKNLREKLDVPVGIIECAWGGKPVQAFTSKEAMLALPEAQVLVENKLQQQKNWDASANKNPNQNPGLNSNLHSTIYNGMIAPIAGYGARGAIWYQGESNANPATAANYGELLHCMINDWRKQWDSNLSFYYVQLANFQQGGKDHPLWVVVQDEMRRLLEEANGIGMAVINDIGDAKDIHPRNKKDVGARLARLALSNDYGDKKIVISGPLYKSHVINGVNVEVSFSHSLGIKSRDAKPLGAFELCDAEGKWLPAEATLKGEKVIVTSKQISKPTNVRYAWNSYPTDANLVNGEGLPTSCFVGGNSK